MAALTSVMLHPIVPPFVDLEAILSTAECWDRGFNVYVTNPCDSLLRTMNYSPLWLRITPSLDRVWAGPIGCVEAVAFCLSLGFLPPTRRLRDQTVMAVAAASSVTIFAIERGNFDCVVYMATLAVAICLERSIVVRGLGYAALCLLAMLKLYPVVTLAVLVRERIALCFAFGAAALLAVVAFYVAFGRELKLTFHNIPKGPLFTWARCNCSAGSAARLNRLRWRSAARLGPRASLAVRPRCLSR